MPGPDEGGIATGHMMDLTREHHLELLRLDRDFRNKILPILRRVEKQIAGELRRVDPSEPARQSFKIKRLESIEAEVNRIIAGGYRSMRDLSQRQTDALVPVEVKWTRGAVTESLNLIGVEFVAAGLTKAQMESVASNILIDGLPPADWWGRGGRRMQERYKQTIQEGLVQGEGIQSLVRRVRGGTKDGIAIPGIMKRSRREAEALVRTSVTAAANDARLATFRANSDIIEGVTHVSTLDSRTTPQCIARDGRSWDLDGNPIGTHSIPFNPPPVHVNCRSIFNSIVAGARRLAGTRASAFGPVPANENFGQFMKRRGEAFQNETLGPVRADLWRKGKITLPDLLDFKGDPLTLEQIEQRIAARAA